MFRLNYDILVASVKPHKTNFTAPTIKLSCQKRKKRAVAETLCTMFKINSQFKYHEALNWNIAISEEVYVFIFAGLYKYK